MTRGVSDLEALSREELVNRWQDIFNTAVPRHLSQPFMRRFIAFELQARALGDLPRGFHKELGKAGTLTARSPSIKLNTGGRLMREWNGKTHVVDVQEDGFFWNGARYKSLSAVAKAITGTKWSGPRFFGLNESGA